LLRNSGIIKKMKYGIRYNQGDIVIIPFPFSDLSSIKQRPAIIVSKNEDNAVQDDIIVAGITSSLRDTKHSIKIYNDHLEEGFIPKISLIKIDKLFTLDKRTAIKRVAKVKKDILEKVMAELRNLF